MRHNVCDFVKDGILIIDRGYNVLFANSALLGQALIGGHGKALPDIAGKKCYEALHSSTAPCKGICPHSEAFFKKKSSTVTHEHNGFFYEISASPVLDEKGEVVEMVEILRDVTERETLAKEVEKTAEFFHTVLDTLAEGVIVIDRDMRVVMANKGYLRQLQTETAEGKHCYELSHGTGTPCHEGHCPVKVVFETGKPAFEIHIHKDKEGREVYVSVSAYPIRDGDGRVARVVETIDDITLKKKADDELKARVMELQEFYDMAVGRELRMVELQGEIEGLRGKLAAIKGNGRGGALPPAEE